MAESLVKEWQLANRRACHSGGGATVRLAGCCSRRGLFRREPPPHFDRLGIAIRRRLVLNFSHRAITLSPQPNSHTETGHYRCSLPGNRSKPRLVAPPDAKIWRHRRCRTFGPSHRSACSLCRPGFGRLADNHPLSTATPRRSGRTESRLVGEAAHVFRRLRPRLNLSIRH